PHAVLGLQPGASETEIKEAYRKSALKHHPDRNPGDASAAAKFQELSDAYAQLS
ncbi:DnaJ domain-containing protein, partial [Pavlovales sp. CCMP2436]